MKLDFWCLFGRIGSIPAVPLTLRNGTAQKKRISRKFLPDTYVYVRDGGGFPISSKWSHDTAKDSHIPLSLIGGLDHDGGKKFDFPFFPDSVVNVNVNGFVRESRPRYSVT